MQTPHPIYLASRSQRRRELLRQVGVAFELLLLRESPGREADVDESPLAGENPATYVRRLAQHKAEVAWLRLGQRKLLRHPILTADTTVDLDGEILAKPADKDDAMAMLRRLSGKTHSVHTAVAVILEAQLEVALSTTLVEFRALRDEEIRHYVDSGEPMDKAGAYGIQGRAGIFARNIMGSYTGIVGLPLFETAELLAHFGRPVL